MVKVGSIGCFCLLLSIGSPNYACAHNASASSKPLSSTEILDRVDGELKREAVPDSSYQDLARLLATEPKNFRVHLVLGKCYTLVGLPVEAQEEYKLALKFGPNEPGPVLALIKQAVKTGQANIASKLISNAIKRFPDNPEIKYWAGNVLFTQNRIKDAEAIFQQVLDSKPSVVGLPSALAVIRYGQHKYDLALDLSNRDLVRDPKLLLANQVAGMSLVKLGRIGEAVKPLKIAFESMSLNREISETYAFALYWQGHYQSALRPGLVNFANTASLYGQNNYGGTILWRILPHVGQIELASAIKEVSSKLGIGKSVAFHVSLAEILDKTGFNQLAIEQYREAIVLEPSFGRAWYGLGLDLETCRHDFEAAKACMMKAKALLPDNEAVSKHLFRLEDRLDGYHEDWAWQIKIWLASMVHKTQAVQ